jgi:hypothetical protein
MLMDFFVFLAAYEIDASISGALDAKGARMKLMKNASILVISPTLPSTSTIGSENINTTMVPQIIIMRDFWTILLVRVLGSISNYSSGMCSSSSSSSSSVSSSWI